MSQQRRFTVGYALTPKKKQSFIQESLLSLARDRGVDLVPVDPLRPLAEQGPFDCLIHKLAGPDWKEQLRRFSTIHPSVPIVDPLDAIERLHNRISMLAVVSDLPLPQPHPQFSFGVPNQIVIFDSPTLADSAAAHNLKFPVIAKPLVADGSAKSHKMSLVFNSDGLRKLKPPIVLQEFINHGGVIFKVYVVGHHVKCVRRRSLPDVTEENFDLSEGSLSFSQISNVTMEDRAADSPSYQGMHLHDIEMPPSEFVQEIAGGLRRAMRLHLFNFDMIRDAKAGNRYLIIDINYFPGYAKMPSYETILTDFFCEMIGKNPKNMVSHDEFSNVVDQEHRENSNSVEGNGSSRVLSG